MTVRSPLELRAVRVEVREPIATACAPMVAACVLVVELRAVRAEVIELIVVACELMVAACISILEFMDAMSSAIEWSRATMSTPFAKILRSLPEVRIKSASWFIPTHPGSRAWATARTAITRTSEYMCRAIL